MLSPKVLAFIRKYQDENHLDLRLKKGLPKEELDLAINQIQGRNKAKNKLPEWAAIPEIVYPPTKSIEQSSSEFTAKHKANIIGKQGLCVDVTGGFGVDAYYISKQANSMIHVEKNKQLSAIVKHNMEVLNATNIEVVQADGIEYLDNIQDPISLIYIDPSRRTTENHKVFLLEDSLPNIVDTQDFLVNKAKLVVVKLSPFMDISATIDKLHYIQSIHIIAYRNEVKELLLFLALDAKKENITVEAVNILNSNQAYDSFQAKRTKVDIPIAQNLSDYIYEPNKAILKGALQDALGNAHGLEKLHPFSHLYTSDKLQLSFPGRIFSLEHVLSAKPKQLKKILPQMTANVLVRNFPLKAPQLAKKMGIKEGGKNYIIGTTLANEDKKLLYCRRIK